MKGIKQSQRQRETDIDLLFKKYQGISREEIEEIYNRAWQNLVENATVVDFLHLLAKRESEDVLEERMKRREKEGESEREKGKKTKKEA